jgi:hypothetical protein
MPDIHVPERGGEGYNARPIHIAPMHVPLQEYVDPARSTIENSPTSLRRSYVDALGQFEASLPPHGHRLAGMNDFFKGLVMDASVRYGAENVNPRMDRDAIAKAMGIPLRDGLSNDRSHGGIVNAMAAQWRNRARHLQTSAPGGQGRLNGFSEYDLHKSGEISKSVLDVGTLTNFASITGGQSLGYVSLDTKFARGTVRPDSFTLYQMLPKSAAFQVVDYWGYVDDPGGALPGSATSAFTSVQSGTLNTSAGIYQLNNVQLKLMLDGRAVTLALMAQNNFVGVNEQENANAALTVLGTADWLNYWGNPAIFPNQYSGLAATIPTTNVFDFLQFYNANASLQGWSSAQTLYNLIYEASAQITSWGRFGRITHALMTPVTNGALQPLVTTLLNQVTTNLTREQVNMRGIVVDGDLQGMNTRMGPIQFPLDLIITARDIPAQGQPRSNGTTPTTTVAPTPPSGVVAAASGAAYALTNWGVNAQFYSGTSTYYYAVASVDQNMNESVLTWSSGSATPLVSGFVAGSGITSSGAVVVSIGNSAAAADATAYRIYRTGAGGFASGAQSPTAVRYIGTALVSGGNGATTKFTDANFTIPGAESIFLLDMHPADDALDYRFLLPLTRVELFAQNLYMPWAVCSIGAIRNRIPKFHGIIRNFIPDSALWNVYGANA